MVHVASYTCRKSARKLSLPVPYRVLLLMGYEPSITIKIDWLSPLACAGGAPEEATMAAQWNSGVTLL